MYFDADIFWEWHKVDNYMVMCRNGEGKKLPEKEELALKMLAEYADKIQKESE
jgi:hypothetical protein